MNEIISKLKSERVEFLHHLEQDIKKNLALQEATSKQLKTLEETKEHIIFYSKQPEHESIIPLCKKLYLPGRIIHTGEYFLDKKAHPESYSVLSTFNQTLENLDKKIEEQKDILDNISDVNVQLEERRNVLSGEDELNSELEEMPDQIDSDKGVALKVGQFYEIVEFED